MNVSYDFEGVATIEPACTPFCPVCDGAAAICVDHRQPALGDRACPCCSDLGRALIESCPQIALANRCASFHGGSAHGHPTLTVLVVPDPDGSFRRYAPPSVVHAWWESDLPLGPMLVEHEYLTWLDRPARLAAVHLSGAGRTARERDGAPFGYVRALDDLEA